MASSHKEVEIKFRVTEIRGLERKLLASGFRSVTPRQHEMNTLYDFADNRLRKRQELLRLRKYGKQWTLTHKGKGGRGRHKSREETETSVVDGDKVHRIFAALGLHPSFRYEKFRSEWSDGKGVVVVDETPIGNFAEIEGRPRWIDATARKLEVRPRDYITLNYAGLFLAWKHRQRSPAREMTFAAVKGKV